LEEAIETLSGRIGELLAPFEAEVALLDTIPGVNRRTAEALLAELGADMTTFPSDHHLASWAALCPGNHESAGKHKSGKTRQGNRWLRTTLIEAALAASNTKQSALAARYRRLRHRGHKKAVVAVAHAILRAAYHILTRQVPYQELGADYLDRRHAERATRRALHLLEGQGYRVTLERAA
jgi:transposase